MRRKDEKNCRSGTRRRAGTWMRADCNRSGYDLRSAGMITAGVLLVAGAVLDGYDDTDEEGKDGSE